MRYEFAAQGTDTFATITARVMQDTELSVGRKRTISSRLRQIVRWEQQRLGTFSQVSAADLIFDPSHVEALAKRLNPTVLRKKSHRESTMEVPRRPISKKTFSNAFSDARFVLHRYGFTQRCKWPELPSIWRPFVARIADQYELVPSKRLFFYFAAHGVGPGDVNQDHVLPFIAAVTRDPRVADAELICRRALRTWNNLMVRHRDIWPQVRLEMPRRRIVWGKPWPYFPPKLEAEVDAFLAPPAAPVAIFKRRARRKLSESTVRTQKEALRCVASVLVLDGVDRQELDSLRSLTTPARFQQAVGRLSERAGGVTYWVEKCARVLLKIAKYSDALQKSEIEEVKRLYAEVAGFFGVWKADQVDRDQKLLNELDNSALADALLQLPTRTLNKALASKRMTKGTAYAVQRALILELWLCAPLRVSNLLRLRLDSFARVTIDGAEYVALRVPGDEVKNKEELEHFLNDDTAALLDLYLRDYLPLISTRESPWLFPGPDGCPKTQQTLRIQMRNYLARNIRLEGFHPHVIRKIAVKLVFDQDPNALEVARRSGGWKSDETLRGAYMQRRHRVSQARYLELLEARRLQSFRPLVRVKRRA